MPNTATEVGFIDKKTEVKWVTQGHIERSEQNCREDSSLLPAGSTHWYPQGIPDMLELSTFQRSSFGVQKEVAHTHW